jgi:hypothetical protein
MKLRGLKPSLRIKPVTKHHAILILGQKKAGTTSLYAAIAATGLPVIDIPKESGVMNAPALLRRTLRQAEPEAILLDATTTYFESGAFSPEFIQSLVQFDSVTVLFICREETDRLASHFRHSLNHDGWRGPASKFVGSGDYLHHARLSPVVSAVKELGIDDIHVLPFSLLKDPEGLVQVVGMIVGKKPDMENVAAENTFGSLQVMPRPVQKFLATPFFQLVLRPLIPSKLRTSMKQVIGSKNVDVEMTELDQPQIQAIAEGIMTENTKLLKTYGVSRLNQ